MKEEVDEDKVYYKTERKEDFEKGRGIEYPSHLLDDHDGKILKLVHYEFPFCAQEEVQMFVCPKWIKSLLYDYNTLEETQRVIKHYNTSFRTKEYRLI